ncbi:MAG: pyridoxal 5'-phosphate synthase glutaminase subunit PdxT [Planctomycetota bacterium]
MQIVASSSPSILTRSTASGAANRSLVPAVLALQGSVEPHVRALENLGYAQPLLVRRVAELGRATHLVIPGGESTALEKLMKIYGLWEPIRARALEGTLALFGTCAGAILMGRAAAERPERLGVLAVDVDRNAYGSQVDSFVARVTLAPPLGELDAFFIRAPAFRNVGREVEVLGTHDGNVILVRQQRLLAATFHPELLTPATRTGDVRRALVCAASRVHQYFLEL